MLKHAIQPLCQHWVGRTYFNWSRLRYLKQLNSIITLQHQGLVLNLSCLRSFSGEYSDTKGFRKQYSYKKGKQHTNNHFNDAPGAAKNRRMVKAEAEQSNEMPENWLEEFGTLTKDEKSIMEDGSYYKHLEAAIDEKEPDFYKHVPLSRYNRKHIPFWYARRIKKFVNRGQIKEAIEMFDKKMIEQDRVKPSGYEYFLLINAMGKVGYTRKANQLYNQMKKRKIYVEPPIYTALFTAYANSPFDDGLVLAHKLRTHMLIKNIQPTYVNYLSMVRAFGVCGDLNVAFQLADEAASEFTLTVDMLNNLLNGCISDKETGFRHAIMIWRMFVKKGIKPQLSSYNLLLRIVKDCGIGNPHLTHQLLETRPSDDNYVTGTQNSLRIENEPSKHQESLTGKQRADFKQIDSALEKYLDSDDGGVLLIKTAEDVGDEECSDCVTNNPESSTREWWELDVFNDSSSVPKDYTNLMQINERWKFCKVPNILNPYEKYSNVVELKEIKTMQDRFALLGGMDNFLETLEREDMPPDIVTFSQLMVLVPHGEEFRLIQEMRRTGVTPDIDFYNLFLKKNKRSRLDPFEMLSMIKDDGHIPNMQTYNLLARLCHRMEQGLQLLSVMEEEEMMPNSHVMTALAAASGLNFRYKLRILQLMSQMGMKANLILLSSIEHQCFKFRNKMFKKEKESRQHERQLGVHEQDYLRFIKFYEKWVKDMKMEQAPHPWASFRDTPVKQSADNEL